MKNIILLALLVLVGLGCASVPNRPPAGTPDELVDFYEADPSLRGFLSRSYGYAIFPSVGKAGFGVGGAYGKGWVYEQGRFVGTSELVQVTIGFQIGGKGYSELIVFENERSFRDFSLGKLKLAAQVSAVAATSGASATAPYRNGVAIFITSEAGLMGEVSIGGQTFSFKPAK